MVYNVEIMDRLDTSDHNMISVNLHFDNTYETYSKIRHDYNNANWQGIRQYLSNVNWEDDVQKSWDRFKQIITEMENKFVPTKNTKMNSRSRSQYG